MAPIDRKGASLLLVVVALCCAALGGCGGSTPPPAAPQGSDAEVRAADGADKQNDALPNLRDIAKLTVVCEAGEPPMDAAVACFALAGLIDEGLIAKDQVESQALAMRAHGLVLRGCKKGDLEACAFRGGLLARELERLDPGSARAKEVAAAALSMLQPACSGDEGFACTAIGIIHERGMGVAADVAQAQPFYRKGCALDHAGGCLRVAELIWQLNDPTDDIGRLRRARDAYVRSCEVGSLDGCEWAGYLFVAQLGGLNQDLDGAFPHYKRACEGERANACMRLGVIYAHRGDRQHALGAFTRACRVGEAKACELIKKAR